MGRHVEGGDEAGEQGERPGHVNYGEIALLFHLDFDVLGGGFELVLQLLELALRGGEAEGYCLGLEEEEEGGRGEG